MSLFTSSTFVPNSCRKTKPMSKRFRTHLQQHFKRHGLSDAAYSKLEKDIIAGDMNEAILANCTEEELHEIADQYNFTLLQKKAFIKAAKDLNFQRSHTTRNKTETQYVYVKPKEQFVLDEINRFRNILTTYTTECKKIKVNNKNEIKSQIKKLRNDSLLIQNAFTKLIKQCENELENDHKSFELLQNKINHEQTHLSRSETQFTQYLNSSSKLNRGKNTQFKNTNNTTDQTYKTIVNDLMATTHSINTLITNETIIETHISNTIDIDAFLNQFTQNMNDSFKLTPKKIKLTDLTEDIINSPISTPKGTNETTQDENVTDEKDQDEDSEDNCNNNLNKVLWRFYYCDEYDRKTDFMQKQSDITIRMRLILLDWLVDVHRKFGLLQQSLFSCINIVDGYLSVCNVNRNKLQLIGCCSMWMASKYHEISAPQATEFVYISDNAFNEQELIECEKLMLSKLDRGLTIVTPLSFAKDYIKVAVDEYKKYVYPMVYTNECTSISQSKSFNNSKRSPHVSYVENSKLDSMNVNQLQNEFESLVIENDVDTSMSRNNNKTEIEKRKKNRNTDRSCNSSSNCEIDSDMVRKCERDEKIIENLVYYLIEHCLMNYQLSLLNPNKITAACVAYTLLGTKLQKWVCIFVIL